MKLSNDLSGYLDFLRFTAALAVMLAHLHQDGIHLGWIPFTHLSHEAVVVFFVLSGFIIHYTTTANNTTAGNYIVARASRVYSVAIPAIIFSLLVAAWAKHEPHIETSQLSGYRDIDFKQVASSLLFLNESWLARSALTLNAPYWSLCYEVTYYIFFGLVFYTHGKTRVLTVVVLALVAGPGPIILLPTWLIGAYASRALQNAGTPHPKKYYPSIMIFLIAPIAIGMVSTFELDLLVRDALKEHLPQIWILGSAQRAVTDTILACTVAANIYVFSSMPRAFRILFERSRTAMAYMAGFSFSIYLFHRPITQIAGHVIPTSATDWPIATLIAIMVLLACWCLSFISERKLAFWRSLLNNTRNTSRQAIRDIT